MHTLMKVLKKTLVGFIIFVQVFAYPATGLADSTDPATVDPVDSTSQTQSTTESPESTAATSASTDPEPLAPAAPTTPVAPAASTGPQKPTGADAGTYHQNPDGTWENDIYIWDPATGQTHPKTPQTYSYNPVTKMWDTTEWYYSPEAGKYLPNKVSIAQNPLVAAAASPLIGSGASINQTGPNSNNAILLGGNNTGTFDLFFDARISNAIGQMSRSGSANVQGNTVGGNATSGDAAAIANILNMIQSSWGTLGSDNIATFVSNIDGNVVGDLYIDPSALTAGSGNTKLDVNVAKNGQINNNVNLDSASGDAGVSGNTIGGNARTGSASAVANLLNLINSAITAKKSFVGVLNINGDLEGDILLPPGLLQSIIASTGPSSNNTVTNNQNNNLNVGVNTNQTINNTVANDAGSGSALVGNNTSGGTATTGKAQTNITLLNLTGHQVVAKDAMLVFVNVFGKWMGLIMDAPAGTNAVAVTGPGSNNTIDTSHNTDINVHDTENSQINNNIHTAAHSGNAGVTGNSVGGNATSGDASAGANILNMIDSTFDLTDWFGVLFINVFGTWHGSFGVDTPYGNTPSTSAAASQTASNSAAAANTPQSADSTNGRHGVFSFIGSGSNDSGTTTEVGGATTSTPVNATTTPHASTVSSTGSSINVGRANWTWTIVGVSSALTLLGLERFLTLRRRFV